MTKEVEASAAANAALNPRSLSPAIAAPDDRHEIDQCDHAFADFISPDQ